jgi:hypothetical protein
MPHLRYRATPRLYPKSFGFLAPEFLPFFSQTMSACRSIRNGTEEQSHQTYRIRLEARMTGNTNAGPPRRFRKMPLRWSRFAEVYHRSKATVMLVALLATSCGARNDGAFRTEKMPFH